VDNTQYILSFNLDETVAQVDSVGRSYTELGATIRGISGQVQDDVESLDKKLSSVNSTLSLLTSSLDLTFSTLGLRLTETSHLLEDISKHSKIISENFASMPSVLAAAGAGPAKDTVGERTADVLGGAVAGGALASGGADAATEAIELVKAEAEKAVKDIQEQLKSLDAAQEKMKDQIGGITGIVGKEVKAAKSSVMSLVSRGTAGVIGGGLLGGAMTAMILGYKEGDRKQAEKGEVLNVLEATGENLFSGPVKKANAWFSKFQERAQFHLGIGRKEIQAAAKQMVDAGFDSTELMAQFDSELGEVGSNTTTLTLGLDKHLNLASGESMKKVVTLTQDYGDSMKGAASNIMNLSLKAQQSGAGISKFIDSVMSGSSALAQYGIDLKEIVGLTSKLEEHYTAMGLDKQYAGQLATTAASGIATGITSFQTPMKMLMASKMGLGEGYEGLQGFEEGWTRVKEGKKEGHFVEMLDAMRQIQEENVGGSSRATKIAFWKEQGLASTAATTFVDEAEKGPFKELLKSTKGSEESLEGLKKAFQTEGEQLSEIQKDQRKIIDGMAAVGKGILQMVSGLIGVIVVGIRSIPALITYAVEKLLPGGDDAKADRIMEAITNTQQKQFDVMAAGWENFKKAEKILEDTMLDKLIKVFGPGLKSALTDDFSGKIPIGDMDKGELRGFIDSNTRELGALRAHVDKFIAEGIDYLMGGGTSFGEDAAREGESLEVGRAEDRQAEARLRQLEAEDTAAYSPVPTSAEPMGWNISGEEVEAVFVARKNMKSQGTGE